MSIYRHVEDESWKTAMEATLMQREALGEDKLRRIKEIIVRAKPLYEAMENLRKLQESDPVKESNIKIVKAEEVGHLKRGWTLVKELKHDKYPLKSV